MGIPNSRDRSRLKEHRPIGNKKNHLFYTNFDDPQSRIANLKSVENWKKEFKRYSITIKKIESYLFVAWVSNYFRQQLGFYNKIIRMAVTGSS